MPETIWRNSTPHPSGRGKTMSETIDEETGEVTETTEPEASETPPQTLSERAAAAIEKPGYWRRVESILGEGGPDYELAFFNAQADIPAMIEADKNNPHFKSRYASLAGVLERVRPILTKHRLSIKQHVGRIHRLGIDSGKQMFLPVLTTLTHVDTGQHQTFPWEMPMEKATPIAIGSLSTTAKRYSICSIFGIATVDDDAAAATIRNKIESEQSADVLDTLIEQINATKTLKDLKAWLKANNEGFDVFSEERMAKLKTAYDEHHAKLADAEASTQDKPESGKKSK
jgi:hypothetical protein